uniref:Uncharacterized protein n=1 Tax=Meloidogyne enterolobii TaxID=390850 RepID=A0A6V7VIA2_MELEN|nr:unnamed protein product [Meloidogyne enterolobii]
MASVPSDINIIINKLSTIDKEKDNEINDIVKESGNDKENIIEESGGYSLIGNDNKYYVQLYNKFWPYRALKIINWFLFLLLVAGPVLTEIHNVRWSENYWSSSWNTKNNSVDGSFLVGQIVLAVLGFIAIIVHCFAKDLFKAAIYSLMDMCFFIFSVPILVVSTIVFSSRSISLYRWLRPKLATFNYTFEAYVDITESEPYPRYPWNYNSMDEYFALERDDTRKKEYDLDMLERRKKDIIINVLINPTFTVLTAVTLILNIYLIFCLYKKMRNAKLWNDGVNDYLALFPNCSSIEMKYAHLGKIKMLQWLLPLTPLLAYIYLPGFRDFGRTSVRYFWAPTIIYLINWLLYYTTLHLRYPKGQACKAIKLSYFFFTDLVLSSFFTLLFIIKINEGTGLQQIYFIMLTLIIFYGCYSLTLCFIYLRTNKGSFNIKLPISIKINFEIKLKKEEELNKVNIEETEEDVKKKENGGNNEE